MNPDLELIKQYAQAIQATGMLEEDTVNGITAMVERARDQFRVADEQGISRETLQLLPDDQRAAMQQVLMEVQRSTIQSEGNMMNARSQLARGRAMPEGLSEKELNNFEAQRRAAIQSDRMSVKSSKMNQDGSTDMVMSDGSLKLSGPTNFGAMSEGEISPDTIYENIDGLDIARRPAAPATSLRPKPRPANLGTMGQTRPQLRP